MNTLTLLSTLTAGALALNVLGFLTARASAYLQTRDQAAPAAPPPRAAEEFTRIVPPAPPPAAAEMAWHWYKRLFTPAGMFGLLLGPLQVPILLINSELLAGTFETILDRPGTPIMVLALFGWVREITNFDLYGLLISLLQMTAAAAIHLAWDDRDRLRLVFVAGLIAALSLVSFEVGASSYRGWKMEGDVVNALLSGVWALGIATAESAVGALLVDRFLLPLLLAVLWSVAAPFRALAAWWSGRPRPPRLVVSRPPGRWSHSLVLAVVYPLAALDTAAMSPLRGLDRAVGRLLPGGGGTWEGGRA